MRPPLRPCSCRSWPSPQPVAVCSPLPAPGACRPAFCSPNSSFLRGPRRWGCTARSVLSLASWRTARRWEVRLCGTRSVLVPSCWSRAPPGPRLPHPSLYGLLGVNTPRTVPVLPPWGFTLWVGPKEEDLHIPARWTQMPSPPFHRRGERGFQTLHVCCEVRANSKNRSKWPSPCALPATLSAGPVSPRLFPVCLSWWPGSSISLCFNLHFPGDLRC